MMVALNRVYSIRATVDEDVYILDCNITDITGEIYDGTFCSRPDDSFGLGPTVRQWLADHQGEYSVERCIVPSQTPYRIAKATPWLRMTDEEVITMDAVMSEIGARSKQIYMAAAYLSSDDPLWAALRQMLVSAFGATRADELLAPEA
jgi:hypothetical protein